MTRNENMPTKDIQWHTLLTLYDRENLYKSTTFAKQHKRVDNSALALVELGLAEIVKKGYYRITKDGSSVIDRFGGDVIPHLR